MVKKTESNELRGNWLKKNVPSDLLSAAEIENYKSRKELAQSFTPKDINDRISAIKNIKHRAICAAAFLTASRINEICTLRKKDVQLKIFNGKAAYVFWIRVEKRNDGFTKKIPVTEANPLRQQFLPVIAALKKYLDAVKDFSQDSFLFGDPGFIETERKYTKKLRYVSAKGEEKVIEKNVTKKYWDTKLRMEVYLHAMQEAGINPHLLRDAALSYLAHTPLLKEQDRVMWIWSMTGWKKIESAVDYVRTKQLSELADVL